MLMIKRKKINKKQEKRDAFLLFLEKIICLRSDVNFFVSLLPQAFLS
jgi:hypothetical protein